VELKPHLKHMYDYMYWANRRYLAVAASLSDEELNRKQGHSWESVHGLLLHMLSSETVWLARWRGNSPTSHLAPPDFPTLAAVTARWAAVEQEMLDFVDTRSEASLEAPAAYSNFEGKTYRLPLWQMMTHVVNHETHHRGELAAMFALMGTAHPEEEVVQYFLDMSGQKKA
jgi:uncharacterized damage-inducible protein DinB